MRLDVHFDALERIAARFSSDKVFTFETAQDMPWEAIDIALQGGIEIAPDELEVIDGLLSYKGRHVILYIRDHAKQVTKALADPGSGRKFHLADCKTLEDMRRKERFDRYVVTQATSGDFEISGIDHLTRKAITGLARLQVCMNCLEHLNYSSYLFTPKGARRAIRDRFELAEFFETYSTRFKYLPSGLADSQDASAYSKDWSEVSRQLRDEASHTCEECGVCLTEHKSLLHVHHVNGVKNDNRRQNLQVLCKDCHRKQPHHQHMYVKATEMATLLRLRRRQRLISPSWESAFKHADLAVRPLLEVARHRGWDAPEVGFEVESRKGERLQLDAAWTSRRLGVSSDLQGGEAESWAIDRPGRLLRKLAEGL